MVFLDVFHGQGRTTSIVGKQKLPKKTTIQFSRDMSDCFKAPKDYGKKRTLPTPEAKVIRQNLMNLIDRWTNTEIPNKALEAAKTLSNEHAECLAGIHPGEGKLFTLKNIYSFFNFCGLFS